MDWNEKVVLVTGGTGSFGQKFVDLVLREHRPRKIIVFSRDELKQHDMRQRFPDTGDSPVRYFLGDIRDADRLRRAFRGVDVVVHAAALKQVPACEYNPFEAVKTNVLGAQNIIDACIDCGVAKAMAVSTDKAVNPVNLYGATKLCMEKIFVQANAYSGSTGTKFSCVRYGNVVGSRGSVIPLFLEQRKTGRVTVTDPRMTRFWITLDQVVDFVVRCLGRMRGGEIFVPRIPTMRLGDLAEALAPGCAVESIGIRPGEKLHEILVSVDEARNGYEYDGMYILEPAHPWWRVELPEGARPLPEGFAFSSEDAPDLMTAEQLREMAEGLVRAETDSRPLAAR